MPQFRKKPVVIEAVQLPFETAPAWLADAMDAGSVRVYANATAEITTLEGVMTAGREDWIIRGVKGELYPCKPDIFAATYDAAEAEKHGGLPVAGYKPQSNAAVDIVNVNKQLEECVLRQLDNLATMKGPAASNDVPSEITVDQRWLAIGRTAIENGFMAVNRAIFKPGRVKL